MFFVHFVLLNCLIMGQTLSEPIVEKHSQKGGDDTLLFGLSDMQGWRISMEDSHAAVLQLNGSSGKDKVSFFGVYDGHGGIIAVMVIFI